MLGIINLSKRVVCAATILVTSSSLMTVSAFAFSNAAAKGLAEQAQQVKVLMPSDAVLLTWRDAGRVETRNAATQKGIAQQYLLVTNTDVDMPLEKLALGEMYFFSFDPKAAQTQYSQVKDHEDDLIARHARKRLLRMNFAAFNEFELVESQISEYRSNYPATIVDYYGVYGAIRDLARYYVDQGRPEDAITLILAELDDRDRAAKQASPRLLADFSEVFQDTGHSAALGDLARLFMPLIQQQKTAWQTQLQSLDLAQQTTCLNTEWDWYWTMNGVRAGETVAQARMRNIERTLEKLDQISLQ